MGVQVQLEVEHKEESSKGKAPREEAHRLRKLVVKNNKVTAEVKLTIPKVDAKAKVPRRADLKKGALKLNFSHQQEVFLVDNKGILPETKSSHRDAKMKVPR